MSRDMGKSEIGYTVTINKEETVASLLPSPELYLPLSNIDLTLPPVDVNVFFCYKKKHNNISFSSMVSVLKKSMAETLVSYYAFGGEMVSNSMGEPQILCNNRGVDFIEAYADVELKDLQLYNPDASVEGKLLAKKKKGVLSVQVTELRCGSLVIGSTFNHQAADAYSMNMFLVAWAEMAQANPLSLQPSFQRSLLNPRSLGYYDASLDNMYVPISTLPSSPPTRTTESDHTYISLIYYITSENINKLQSKASSDGCRRSKLESFSAFLWQIISKATGKKAKKCKMGVVVDGRKRMTSNGSSMSNYFGNVISIFPGVLSSQELNTKPLSWVADAVHECLEFAVNEEHFLRLIDLVQAYRPEAIRARIYCTCSDDEVAVIVSSGLRFPMSKVDFGWGIPTFGSYYFPWDIEAGYVMPMPSPSGNGDWVVYIHLLKGQVDFLETEFSHVFRPFTCQYFN